jgi:hypothetical protein
VTITRTKRSEVSIELLFSNTFLTILLEGL